MKVINRTISTVFIILCNLVFLFPLYASPFYDELHLLSMKDGLADNIIISIFQDRDGFMWFGSNNGLSKYDGVQVRNFNLKNERLKVYSIKETTDTKLWIIANGNLCCFDREKENFISTTFKESDKTILASKVQIINDSLFWVINRNILFQVKRKDITDKFGNLVKVEFNVEKMLSNLIDKQTNFLEFCFSTDRRYLYLATDDDTRILIFDTLSNSLIFNKKISHIKDVSITSIFADNEYIWLSSMKGGVFRFHISTQHTEQFLYNSDFKSSMLSHTDAYDIIAVGNSYLAVTWNGYTLFTPDENDSSKMLAKVYDNVSFMQYRNLETRMISSFYNSSGVLWIGTRGGGAIALDLRQKFYRRYDFNSHNAIGGQVSDRDGRIWLATFHKGIMRSDEPFTKSGRLHFSSVKKGTPVLCAIKDSKDNLWFGNSQGEIISYEWISQSFKTYSLEIAGKRIETYIKTLFIDKNNRFWIGTDMGLFLFNQDTKQFEIVPLDVLQKEEPIIFSISEDTRNCIWLGTNRGVLRLEGHGDQSLRLTKGYEERGRINSRVVNCLLAASDGAIYVGYTDGFGVISLGEEKMSYFYTTKSGLCNDNISCIIEDSERCIWLGNLSGISRYSRHQHLFYNYYISGSNVSAMLLNKTLFFGNNNSLTYFEPDKITPLSINCRVRFIGLEVNNKLVNIGEAINDQIILMKNISYVDKIELKNENRDFSLCFSRLDYSEEQHKYMYRLYPYQQDWLVTSGGKVAYTNLSAGDYTFEVKALYPDSVEGEVTSLQITIFPHWRQTLAFRLFLLLCVVLFIGYIVYWLWRRQYRIERILALKNEIFMSNMERDKEKQIRAERENFFTKSAHELRTPLTLILSPLQGILKKLAPADNLYEPLSIVYRSCLSLSNLVNHLLYVQKIDAGMVKLKLSEWDIAEIIRKQADSFRQIALVKECNFAINLESESVNLWIDVNQMESVIRNLLSNAFKYTPRRGCITLSLSRKKIDGRGYCLIAVSDNGPGIPENMQEGVFDSFVTVGQHFSTSVGVGLHIVKHTIDMHHGYVTLDSHIGKGTCFTLYILEGVAHFANDDCDWVTYKPANENLMEENWALPLPVNERGTLGGKPTLLIVEDNEDMRGYLCRLFREQYVVIESSDGKEGLEMARKYIPQLIISDVMMPMMDGFEFCRGIRDDITIFHIPIILLTARTEDEDHLRSLRLGADDFMMKPFDEDVLREKVKNLIGQREQLRLLYTQTLMLQPTSPEKKEDTFMHEVILIIEKNLANESFSVKMLAEMLNMSQPTLYRKMKQSTPLSILEVIRGVRLSKAASLIMEKKYSLLDITEMVGFESVTVLRKHFVAQFGVLPSRYGKDK